MTGASIEETLELWASSLRDVKARMRPLFTQQRVAVSAGLFLDGLLGEERHKTGWVRAEVAGDPGPWRQQAILGRGRWDADGLRGIVRDDVIEHLADDDAVLVLDETGFLKQGKASCGVGRQYVGSWPSSPRGARPEPASRPWSGWKVGAGRSRMRSRRPKTSWASITTRRVPGTAGTGMFRW